VTEQRIKTAFVLLTDIMEQSSVLVAANAEGEQLASRAFGRPFKEGQLVLPGVMSRKKQLIPPLASALS
jgi:manganese-dependent inorganic pyrophosphatase